MHNCPKCGEDLTRYEAYADLESRLASLEEEKARLIRTCPPGTCRVQSPALCNCFADPEVAERLAQAEAREAAMRAAIERLLAFPYEAMEAQQAGWPERAAQARAALSPDAGRALAAEVEALREVARLLKIVEQYGCEIGGQTWSELRDALAKRGE